MVFIRRTILRDGLRRRDETNAKYNVIREQQLPGVERSSPAVQLTAATSRSFQ